MGGKTWSRHEEVVFWRQLIPHTAKRLGDDRNNEERDWNWVAEQMQAIMGDTARRQYTHLCVSEHYFQNTCLGNFSPNVGKLHKRYYKFEQELKAKHAAARLELEEHKKKAAAATEETKGPAKREDDFDDATDTDHESDSKHSGVDIKMDLKEEAKPVIKEEVKPAVKEEDDKSLVKVKTDVGIPSAATSVSPPTFLVLTPPAPSTVTAVKSATPCPDGTGTRNDHAVGNRQCPAAPFHSQHPASHGHSPATQASFCRSGDQHPAPHRYHHYHHNEARYQPPLYPYNAHQHRSMAAEEDESDNLFVAQQPASWAHGSAALLGDEYDYGHCRYC
ncbi:hypothetical protein VTJ83DRAFT_5820 [Remersonia thermophila]|uniref:Myb-like domain-containing protein n=1 Tax=Remersonia thermophila TaxID=72144 RepID=A0ABR4D7Y3_9PEZI